MLVPTAGGDNFTPNPYARVEDDGSFELNTYSKHDGAPAGDYVVTVVWKKAVTPTSRERGPDLLKGRFADPRKSQLRVQITPGNNELQTLQLKVDPRTLASLER
jgi:hypothetical protein